MIYIYVQRLKSDQKVTTFAPRSQLWVTLGVKMSLTAMSNRSAQNYRIGSGSNWCTAKNYRTRAQGPFRNKSVTLSNSTVNESLGLYLPSNKNVSRVQNLEAFSSAFLWRSKQKELCVEFIRHVHADVPRQELRQNRFGFQGFHCIR